MKCLWCEVLFERRRDGRRAQRFCSASCRSAFFSAARRWAVKGVETGILTVGQLRDESSATCTLRIARSRTRLVGRVRKYPERAPAHAKSAAN